MCCNKCLKMHGGLLLVFGILFLIRDLTGWGFWGINWWTIAFILAGLAAGCTAGCPMCRGAVCCKEEAEAPKAVKKKK